MGGKEFPVQLDTGSSDLWLDTTGVDLSGLTDTGVQTGLTYGYVRCFVRSFRHLFVCLFPRLLSVHPCIYATLPFLLVSHVRACVVKERALQHVHNIPTLLFQA